MNHKKKDKLRLWQERLARNQTAYAAETARMDEREELYLGARKVAPVTKGDHTVKTPHVRNLCAELIEAQVDSNIPQPKVTARRAKDEKKAKLIEDMLRNELDRLPFEQLNDMMERTVPIQGGAGFLVEWDNTERTHTTVGELTVSTLHPKQFVPQDGVYSGVEDMDYIILKIPQTKEYIRRRYDVDVSGETEREPEIKGSGESSTADDLVTQYVAYYRNDKGGIGLYSWVNDVELENLEDYQARRLRRCAKCGEAEPPDDIEPAGEPANNGLLPGMEPGGIPGAVFLEPEGIGRQRGGRKVCPYCGSSKWEESEEEYEELYRPIERRDGSVIPGLVTRQVVSETEVDALGLPIVETVTEPTRIPFYKPDIFPVILQKNVSVYGSLLGDSDIDKIADHQNTTNRMEAKIIEKLCKGGSYLSLPDTAGIKADGEDLKVIRLGSAADASLISVYNVQADVEYDLVYLNQVYEEARQVIGITDSYQGRADRTATSGKAKEFAAAQSAGRLESKRLMKDTAYAALFEAMFKFKLAYADEPRPVISNDIHGNTVYDEFDRYDFLEQDETGEWYWNDQFLFSCDTTAPLASNREAMWQETRMNLQSGAFGDPTSIQTLILFWGKMELLHYPGAGETKQFLEEELQRQQTAQRMQQMQQMQGGGQPAPDQNAALRQMAAQAAATGMGM